MEKERLLAFTDGVIAIIITIMVLELKVPQDTGIGESSLDNGLRHRGLLPGAASLRKRCKGHRTF